MRWTKSVIGKHTSNTAIMSGKWHIAKFVTYIDNEKVEKFLLSDCSDMYKHKSIAWFDSSNKAKEYAENLK